MPGSAAIPGSRVGCGYCGDPVGTRLQAIRALAFHEPRLRVLRPYTSHWTLCFSSTPQWPFTRDHPTVDPAETLGRYVVRTRPGRVYDETDAAGALSTCWPNCPTDRQINGVADAHLRTRTVRHWTSAMHLAVSLGGPIMFRSFQVIRTCSRRTWGCP
ncbi:DUF6193 family natural product biosynthesis protein [Dactylosporangium sp. CA-233914]|uniref:DUF6193 family natural product biosynthesis protein n=1 Tax=Dactylosporangium sp. CA-233914 TaxID=3239934 RepID=UPI003D8CED4D